MTNKIFYEKVGRRYVPVKEYNDNWIDAFPHGAHVVMCHPGGQSRRYNIDPNYAALIAAGRVAEDAISKHIMDVSALRTQSSKKVITPEQKEAWERLSAAFGQDMIPLEYCSYREAAEAGVSVMIDEAKKLMKNEGVQKAYDHFILMCKLAKENGDI